MVGEGQEGMGAAACLIHACIAVAPFAVVAGAALPVMRSCEGGAGGAKGAGLETIRWVGRRCMDGIGGLNGFWWRVEVLVSLEDVGKV